LKCGRNVGCAKAPTRLSHQRMHSVAPCVRGVDEPATVGFLLRPTDLRAHAARKRGFAHPYMSANQYDGNVLKGTVRPGWPPEPDRRSVDRCAPKP
jgi:hypothetical protein